MTIEEIQKFIETNTQTEKPLKISFKKRDAIYGYFIDCRDASSLNSKNFWRIVSSSSKDEWVRTKDINLSRLYSGSDFSKLSVEK